MASNRMMALLANHVYHQSKHASGFFIHATRDISFTLVVDNVRIKYKEQEDVDH